MRDAWEGMKEWLRDVEGVNESIEDIHQLQMLVSIISDDYQIWSKVDQMKAGGWTVDSLWSSIPLLISIWFSRRSTRRVMYTAMSNIYQFNCTLLHCHHDVLRTSLGSVCFTGVCQFHCSERQNVISYYRMHLVRIQAGWVNRTNANERASRMRWDFILTAIEFLSSFSPQTLSLSRATTEVSSYIYIFYLHSP